MKVDEECDKFKDCDNICFNCPIFLEFFNEEAPIVFKETGRDNGSVFTCSDTYLKICEELRDWDIKKLRKRLRYLVP